MIYAKNINRTEEKKINLKTNADQLKNHKTEYQSKTIFHYQTSLL